MSPSPFIVEWVERLASRSAKASAERLPRALDVAMGRGRHALLLARAGYRTFGVDRRLEAAAAARQTAVDAQLALLAWCGDLAATPLPRDFFDLVVVTRYLQRDLFPALRESVRPGGVVLYETFTTRQLALGRGPRSPDHLLDPQELVQLFAGFDVLCYAEHETPDAVAQIAARR